MPLDDEYDRLPATESGVDPLPIAHTTRLGSLRSILANGSLRPTHCSRLGREVLYLFYGPPSYRTGDPLSRDQSFSPIAFVFSPIILDHIATWAPFDTGAALGGRFAPWLLGPAGIAEYLVRSRGPHTGGRLVYALFGDNIRYLQGRGLPKAAGSAWPNVASVLDLYASDLTAAAVDHRQFRFEIHAERELTFDEHLLWVGLPTSHLADFQAFLRTRTIAKPRYYTYASHIIVNPRELSAELEAQAKRDLSMYFD